MTMNVCLELTDHLAKKCPEISTVAGDVDGRVIVSEAFGRLDDSEVCQIDPSLPPSGLQQQADVRGSAKVLYVAWTNPSAEPFAL